MVWAIDWLRAVRALWLSGGATLWCEYGVVELEMEMVVMGVVVEGKVWLGALF